MIFIQAILLLVVAPFALIFIGLLWLWLGHKLLACLMGR
jgi:hypothetical protein